MCGRFRRTTKEEELARIYSVPIPKQPDLPVSYNITPSQNVLAIQGNELRPTPLGTDSPWAKDQKFAYRTINARAETDKAPSYCQAFIKRRCLIA
jgi:putative SOS response-associated peptidase YedK